MLFEQQYQCSHYIADLNAWLATVLLAALEANISHPDLPANDRAYRVLMAEDNMVN